MIIPDKIAKLQASGTAYAYSGLQIGMATPIGFVQILSNLQELTVMFLTALHIQPMHCSVPGSS